MIIMAMRIMGASAHAKPERSPDADAFELLIPCTFACLYYSGSQPKLQPPSLHCKRSTKTARTRTVFPDRCTLQSPQRCQLETRSIPNSNLTSDLATLF